MPLKPVPFEERFWAKVDVRGPDECWEWTAAKNSRGYGQIKKGWREGMKKAHRVAYELMVGHIPDGLCVLHHCDNPGCVNPNHLFLGTRADNNLDKVRKGRSNKGRHYNAGVKHGMAKLKEDQVISIRQEYAKGGITLRELGAMYDVHLTTIRLAVNQKSWSHI